MSIIDVFPSFLFGWVIDWVGGGVWVGEYILGWKTQLDLETKSCRISQRKLMVKYDRT